ncbi:MAG: DUF3127 domain-containing protein [Bacteroidota bacterium]
MDLKLQGNVTQVLEEQGGQGKNGPWRKREFILEIPGNYPKSVCITQWGDNIDKHPVAVGTQITASTDIQSREYNGRWYTEVKAWRIEQAEDSASHSAPPAEGFEIQSPSFDNMDDDLPF